MTAETQKSLARMQACQELGAPRDLFISYVDFVDDSIVLWSCEPKSYSAAIVEFPRLARMSAKERRSWVIEDTGVHWGQEFSLNIAGVKAAAGQSDPTTPAVTRARGVFGQRVREMREKAKVRQVDVEGLSEREMRRIEKGEVGARTSAQNAIASALGMGLDEFMQEAWQPEPAVVRENEKVLFVADVNALAKKRGSRRHSRK